MIFSLAIIQTLLVAASATSLSEPPERFLEGPPIQEACPVSARRWTRGRHLAAGDGAIISNGVIKLGVNPTGQLNVPGDIPSLGETEVGLRFLLEDGTESEATSFGCECEGWGAAADGDSGWANDSVGGVRVDSVNFTSTSNSALSSVVIPGGKLKVTHDFHETPTTPNLFEVTVTLENLSGSTITDVRYRRVMDFDIYPTVSCRRSILCRMSLVIVAWSANDCYSFRVVLPSLSVSVSPSNRIPSIALISSLPRTMDSTTPIHLQPCLALPRLLPI